MPPAPTLLKPSGEPLRHKIMRETVQALCQAYPEEMEEVAKVMREQTARQFDPKTGKWATETDASCYFKVSFPQVFMDVLRPVMRRLLPDEPPFADDDADLIFLMREFPDLLAGGKSLQAPRRKDHRPHTQIK